MDSNELFHEMLHAYQYQNEKNYHLAVMTLNDYLDDKGYLHEGMDQELVNSFVEFNIVEAFKRTIEYKDYKYDSNRDIQSNFANLREITKNC